jgi:hypothetical protein
MCARIRVSVNSFAAATTAATGDCTVGMVFVMAGVKQNPHPERVDQDGGNDDYLLEARYITLSLNYNDALLPLSLLLSLILATTTTTTESSPPPPSTTLDVVNARDANMVVDYYFQGKRQCSF